MGLPNELGVGRVNRLLNRLLQIKGGSPAPVLVPEIQANLVLENDRPEWEFLGGGSLWWVSRVSPAVAARFAFVELVNPPGSGVLAVVEVVSPFTSAGACEFEISFETGVGVGGTPLAGSRRDGRQQIGRRSALTSQIGDGAAGAAIPGFSGRHEDSGSTAIPVAILTPGTNLFVANLFVATALTVSFGWRERALEQSEAA